MKYEFIPVKTRVVMPPKDEIWDIVDSLEVRDGDVVFITSKIMGIHQGRTRVVGEVEKEDLIRECSEYYFPYDHPGGWHVNLTVTDGVLIPAAGIDESNANGHYIMWPRDVDALCRELRDRLMKRTGAKRLGVVSTDSHTTPLRWGVTGITIGLAGVEPTRDIRGDSDIFGREMKITKVNQLDALTGMAVLLMGEADEQTPVVILRGYDGLEFSDTASMEGYKIGIEEDLYKPLLDVMREYPSK